MSRTHSGDVALRGELLSLEPYPVEQPDHEDGARKFVLEIKDEAASKTLLASLPLLERLLLEKSVQVRERRLEQMVDFMTEQMVVPSDTDLKMAKRLAARHAKTLNDFGFYTAEQLAEANGSQAATRTALVDNWRKRRQVFAVPHPQKTARDRDVYPAFQFKDHKPIKAVQAVIKAFGEHKAPWKLAMWFTSNNGWLPNSAKPVELLISNARAVIDAAQRDSAEHAV